MREVRCHDLTHPASIQSVNYKQGKNTYIYFFNVPVIILSTRLQNMNLLYNGIMFKDVNVQEDVFYINCREWQSPAEDAFFIQSDYLKKQRNSSKHVSGS